MIGSTGVGTSSTNGPSQDDTENPTTVPPGKQVPIIFGFVLIGGVILLCWRLIFLEEQLTYRDAGYLYYPLFEFVQKEWQSGQVPLWNPYCGLGQPLLADGTSSVFYPGKLIFFAGWLSFNSRFGIYIAVHLILAGWGAYACGRGFELRQESSALVGIGFAFGGPLLSQTCNVVYLVSGAWLPWAVLLLWRLNCKPPKMKNAVLLGSVWSLMVLGGDSQMVYLTLIGASMLIIGHFSSGKRSDAIRASLGLVLATIIGFALAAVQILPSIGAMNQSVRSQFERPHTIYQMPMYLTRTEATFSEACFGLAEQPWPEQLEPYQHISHHSDLYQFSMPPWTLVETFLPGFGGRAYPTDSRWIDGLQIPPEQNWRSWYVSKFLGVLVVLLAICGLRFRAGPRANGQTWLTWNAIVFCVGSFGIFGPGMIWNLFFDQASNNTIGNQVGGLYWLMNIILPKFIVFRYPAKLFMLSSFSISVLAGFGFERLLLFKCRTRFSWSSSLILLSLLLGAAWFWFFQPWIAVWLLENPLTDLTKSNLNSIARTMALSAGFLLFWRIAILKYFKPPFGGRANVRIGYVTVSLVMLDLLLANSWIINSNSTPAYRLRSSANLDVGLRLIGSKDNLKMPVHPSQSDFFELEQSQLLPKHHLPLRRYRIDSFSSIERADWAWFFDEVSNNFTTNEIQQSFLGQASIAQLTTNVKRLPTIETLSPAITLRRTRSILAEFGSTAIVESDDPKALEAIVNKPRDSDPSANRDLENSRVDDLIISAQSRTSGSLTFEVEIAEPRLMVVNEQFDFDWRCRTRPLNAHESQMLPTFRTNRVMLGVVLPAGKQRVVFEYWPKSFRWGTWISGIGWFLALVYGITWAIRRNSGT